MDDQTWVDSWFPEAPKAPKAQQKKIGMDIDSISA
jgi:hypothetical protein